MPRSHSETGLNMTVAQKGPPDQLGSRQVWGHKMKGVPRSSVSRCSGPTQRRGPFHRLSEDKII